MGGQEDASHRDIFLSLIFLFKKLPRGWLRRSVVAARRAVFDGGSAAADVGVSIPSDSLTTANRDVSIVSGGINHLFTRFAARRPWASHNSPLETELSADPGVKKQSRGTTPRLFSLNPKFPQRVAITPLSRPRVSVSSP